MLRKAVWWVGGGVKEEREGTQLEQNVGAHSPSKFIAVTGSDRLEIDLGILRTSSENSEGSLER